MSIESTPSASTRTLDHIVHLTPPGSFEETTAQFTALGFKHACNTYIPSRDNRVLPGGTHADGLTGNVLIVLADTLYLELLSFTHPPSHYPVGTPARHARDAHPWAPKHPGWIDLAGLGNSGTPSLAALINARAAADESGVRYTGEARGGRRRPDGRVLEWLISAPERARGALPFFCGDVTPRAWRVPLDPASNAEHPNGVRGVAHVRLLAAAAEVVQLTEQLSTVLGVRPRRVGPTASEVAWDLEQAGASGYTPQLLLSAAQTEEEHEYVKGRGSGIYEVGFRVHGGQSGYASTPYGRIVWVPEAV
ncbi:glyoxalase-like domain-containing protein [Amylocystis lapponica]|nr:glyoxalase-like domain-containing protein [Amylocystis lapponica]